MKKNQNHTKLQVTLLASVALALTACGGGGGTTATATVTSTVTPDTKLITSVPANTYSVTTQSEEAAAFSYLNSERSRCGFGLVAQSSVLDIAAKNHADWQLINSYASHSEVTGTPGFTGVGSLDRIIAAGYGTSAEIVKVTDELTTSQGRTSKTGFGVESIRSLLNAPYHMNGLLSGYRDIGISVRNDVDTATTATYGYRVHTQINLAIKSPAVQQLIAATDVQTYPCNGSSNVSRQLTDERPNPVPGRNLTTNPLGLSIFVAVREGQIIAIASVSMTNLSNGSAVTMRTPVTSANDLNPGYFASHQAYVSADTPLAANTGYQVTLNGTNNGTAFSRTFTFTTGS